MNKPTVFPAVGSMLQRFMSSQASNGIKAAALNRLSCLLTGNDSINHTSLPEKNQVRRAAASGGAEGSEGRSDGGGGDGGGPEGWWDD